MMNFYIIIMSKIIPNYIKSINIIINISLIFIMEIIINNFIFIIMLDKTVELKLFSITSDFEKGLLMMINNIFTKVRHM